eukprot:GHRR01017624.1.p2 GENE.GHRR01017624.1~~GHRR01017624.1.p2  ORF type:complete len:121 (-),score=50.89 GHRR01017624.1:425-787(-)
MCHCPLQQHHWCACMHMNKIRAGAELPTCLPKFFTLCTGLDAWHLAAAEQLISASKSVVIAAALLHNRVTIGQAVAAARVEEDFQLEDWGMVEAGHDLDIADMQTRMGAPTVFIKLLAMP